MPICGGIAYTGPSTRPSALSHAPGQTNWRDKFPYWLLGIDCIVSITGNDIVAEVRALSSALKLIYFPACSKLTGDVEVGSGLRRQPQSIGRSARVPAGVLNVDRR